MSQRGRKQKNDDDGLSTAGKVAVGVAAAAAGAAIGYIGGRLLSAWLSEPEKEKPKKCDSDDSEFDESKRTSKDEVANDSGACPLNTTKHVAVKQPSLHDQLFHYYEQYVTVPSHRMKAAQKMVDELTDAVKCQLRQPNSLKGLALRIGDLVSFGSASEDLQVIRPNCFDVMIPVMFGSQCHTREACVQGRFEIVVPDDGSDDRQLCDAEHRLITKKLLDAVQVVIEKAAGGVSGCQCEVQPLTDNATAVSLVVCADGFDHISVNFVPFVIIDNHLFLPAAARPWPSEDPDLHSRLWVESFVRQEKWSIDRFDSSVCGHLIALRILKAIRLNHLDQFGTISSYHLKILLFHVLEDLPDCCDWDSSAVGERLIDLLTRLTEVLRENQLPHYFEHHVNLLHDVPAEMCNNLAKFLAKKLAHNDITSLLKTDY